MDANKAAIACTGVKVGQSLQPCTLWNQTAGRREKLAVPTKVLGIKLASSQSGLLFKVRSLTGLEQWLDAGWFEYA